RCCASVLSTLLRVDLHIYSPQVGRQTVCRDEEILHVLLPPLLSCQPAHKRCLARSKSSAAWERISLRFRIPGSNPPHRPYRGEASRAGNARNQGQEPALPPLPHISGHHSNLTDSAPKRSPASSSHSADLVPVHA